MQLSRVQGCVEAKLDLHLGGALKADTKVIYRRYASLFFICAISPGDNELITLETIHRYVEVLDRYFGNVSAGLAVEDDICARTGCSRLVERGWGGRDTGRGTVMCQSAKRPEGRAEG